MKHMMVREGKGAEEEEEERVGEGRGAGEEVRPYEGILGGAAFI
ncbi:hypothetical protein [Bartonella sp. B39]